MRRQRHEHNDDQDDDADVPLHHKKPFGAGLKRKRIDFVRATEDEHSTAKTTTTTADQAKAVGDLYASIVLANRPSTTAPDPAAADVCAVCSLPITTSPRQHEASLAHQVSLAHSHPPSALDRSRMGLRTLRSQGWDPDARRGLGLDGDGARFPVKVSGKHDNLGVGAAAPDPSPDADAPARPQKLTAREMKAEARRQRHRAERLQAELYGRLDVESYLRGGRGGGDGLR